MKTGYELFLQKNMSEADKAISKRYMDMFISRTAADPKKRYFGIPGGGYSSGLWRGRYGIEVGWYPDYKGLSKTVVFRRLSSKRRKFGCVYADELVVKNDQYLDKSHPKYRELVPDGEVPSMCQCPRHKGSLCVAWRGSEPELELYFFTGRAKG